MGKKIHGMTNDLVVRMEGVMKSMLKRFKKDLEERAGVECEKVKNNGIEERGKLTEK